MFKRDPPMNLQLMFPIFDVSQWHRGKRETISSLSFEDKDKWMNVMDKKGPYSLQALDGPFLMELATI